MRQFLKWAFGLLAVLIAVPVVGLLCFYAYYRGIVSAKPGGLEVPFTPAGLTARVDPFIATGGVPYMCGHDTPAATTPFGMVRLAPDTASILVNAQCRNRSGYYFGDNKIIGFSHTRLVGADSREGGVFRVFPTTGARVAELRDGERFARFSHRDETAFPGYYAVRLPKEGVLAELSATPRVGVHRYTFEKGATPHLLLDVTSALDSRSRASKGSVKILSDKREVEGSVQLRGSFSGRYDGLDVYFAARFSRPFAAFGTIVDGQFEAGVAEAAADDLGMDVSFDTGTEGPNAVELRLAISYVSISNARENLAAEASDKSFEEVVAAANATWQKRLERVQVKGGTERERRIFYTSLYHAFVMPSVFNDVNGEYTGFDKQVHAAEGFAYFTDMSIWDTFRTVHPLYTLIAPEDHRDMLVSLTEMVKAGGCLPRWPSGAGYTNCMFGTPADILVSEAYLKGVRDFDVDTAYAAMRQTGLTGKPESSRFGGRRCLEEYLRLGYCPSDKMERGVSSTMEYAWADHAISLLAKELGHEEDAALFARHAQNYRNHWNPGTLYFETRDSEGNWPAERDPLALSYIDRTSNSSGYVEGSGLQWRWCVPHDPQGLISLFPSPEMFVAELEAFFENTRSRVGWWHPGSHYWHGNEHGLHAAYLFNAAGRPDLTQKWVRRILETKYSDDYVGLDGNDDGGTLSAWYVFSALGFYPIAGTTRYEIGSPLFDEADVQMGGHVLKIIAEDNGPDHLFVQKVWLNDTPLDRTWFTHDEIAQGGTLRFLMGPAPQSL